jgi:hypothetical protein
MLPNVASARNADFNLLLGPLQGAQPTLLKIIHTGREMEKPTPCRHSAVSALRQSDLLQGSAVSWMLCAIFRASAASASRSI